MNDSAIDKFIYENYSHMFCSCGGILMLKHHEEDFACEKCNKKYPRKSISYSTIMYNDKTGVRYPVKKKGRR